jgi:thiamine biosynthesis lipoprotein
MRFMQRPSATAAVVCLVAFAPGHRPSAAHDVPPVRVEANRVSMGCVYSIVAYGRRADDVKGILEDALDEVDRIDRLASNYRSDSALSQVNRQARRGLARVDPELFEIIAEAMTYAADSAGAFDITVGPLVKAWGFYDGDGHVPDPHDLARVRRDVGYAHVALDAAQHTIAFDRSGVEIDLGGIAKGYAVDRVVRILASRGITAALVSAGGSTVYALGTAPGALAWDVAVQDPLDRRKVALTLPLKDRALSVSGVSERSFEADGVQVSHLVDPRTGRPVQGVLTVAVIAGSGTVSDALGTALFVEGAGRARRLPRSHPGSEAYFFLPGPRRSLKTVHLGPDVSALSAGADR